MAVTTGCSSDYLDVKPTTNISADQVTSSLRSAQMAVNGLSCAMNTQYQNTSINQMNGEGYVNFNFNDGFGPDFICQLVSHWSPSMYNWKEFEDQSAIMNTVPWMYCYNLINQANVILDGVDNIPEGEEADRNYIKAQALTFRAHAYIKLVQFYAPRWEDSNNGEANAVVLRLTAGTDAIPFSSMGAVMKQIYSDLEDAIKYFEEAKDYARDYKWQVDASVARGLFARAAMIKHDWQLAQQMAHDARQAYKVMDNSTMFAGFYTDNTDVMWSQSDNEADIYYWSLGSHYACNGQYVNAWGIGGVGINLDLYNALDPNDVRRKMYLTPDKVHEVDRNTGKITEADFWNKDLVDGSSNCNMAIGGVRVDPNNRTKKYGLKNIIIQYCDKYANEIFTGNLSECINEGFYAYINVSDKSTDATINLGNKRYASLVNCPLGSSLKFWSKAPYGVGAMPFMRASEMCITEAEAAYMAGDYTTALSCLKEINDIRIPGYSFNSKDESLLEEIRLCRRIELFGEGHNFSDFKRWNLPLVRRAWKADDPTSGNYPISNGIEVQPDECNGWRFVVPKSETEYNKAVTLADFYK